MVLAYTSTPPGGGMCLSPGHAGSRSDSSEPIPMVQCGHSGPEEGQYPAFLRGLQMPQCMYEERLIPPAMDSGGPGKHGRVSAFLINGFQVRLLADQDGPRIAAVHGLYGGEPQVLRVYPHAIRAPATFQPLMQNTLGELNLTYCVIYLDDVIVFSRMEEEHLECLCVVFKRFQEFNLKLKPLKCSFFQSEIVYLAHHISRRSILPSQENVQAVQEFPMPKTYTQVRVFCG